MKKIIVTGSLLVLLSNQALADWTEEFPTNAANYGPEFAVEEALKVGAAPEDIMALVQRSGSVEPTGAIKALYCAGISGPAITAAATLAGLPESAVAAGYRQSVGQCSPAATLSPDPFSRTPDIAAKNSPVGGGVPPGPPPGIEGGGPPPVIPPVTGGGGGRPPSVSPPGFN